ncbi:hypothetical protein NO2_0548 [Candidatus Termititenax persephonae]|uniref:DUF4116 domain-containing protein n=1 Tax=Candidatus Termititenax persephonae TaxID=2218525 RepID=A0A388TFR9_9BACT|nr:hypothetical protein NO2_0548 [Candidatus Termititenax persephonae]
MVEGINNRSNIHPGQRPVTGVISAAEKAQAQEISKNLNQLLKDTGVITEAKPNGQILFKLNNQISGIANRLDILNFCRQNNIPTTPEPGFLNPQFTMSRNAAEKLLAEAGRPDSELVKKLKPTVLDKAVDAAGYVLGSLTGCAPIMGPEDIEQIKSAEPIEKKPEEPKEAEPIKPKESEVRHGSMLGDYMDMMCYPFNRPVSEEQARTLLIGLFEKISSDLQNIYEQGVFDQGHVDVVALEEMLADCSALLQRLRNTDLKINGSFYIDEDYRDLHSKLTEQFASKLVCNIEFDPQTGELSRVNIQTATDFVDEIRSLPKETVLQKINAGPYSSYFFRYFQDTPLANDREIALAAITNSIGNLQYVSEQLRGDKQFMLAAVQIMKDIGLPEMNFRNYLKNIVVADFWRDAKFTEAVINASPQFWYKATQVDNPQSALLRDCADTAAKLKNDFDITELERIPELKYAQHLLAERTILKEHPEQIRVTDPLTVVFYPKADYNGAFRGTEYCTIMDNPRQQMLLFENETDMDFKRYLRLLKDNLPPCFRSDYEPAAERKYLQIIMGGHGTKDITQWGPRSVYNLDPSDYADLEFVELVKSLNISEAYFVSCSVAEEEAAWINQVNRFSELLPENGKAIGPTAAANVNAWVLDPVSGKIQAVVYNKSYVSAYIASGGRKYQFPDKATILQKITENPGYFADLAGTEYADDEEIVKKALALALELPEPRLLQFVSERLRNERELIGPLLLTYPYWFYLAEPALRDDKQFVLAMINSAGSYAALYIQPHLSDRLAKDPDILAALQAH